MYQHLSKTVRVATSIALIFLSITWLSLAQTPTQPEDVEYHPEYVIGPSDVLNINVWKVPEITGRYVVGPDGVISLPLIGEVRAQGETRKSLAKKIRKMLLSDYKTPVVSIDIVDYASKYVYVMGRVERPGIVVLPDEPTLVKALALAGGVIHGYRGAATYRVEGFPLPMGKASIIRGNNQIIMVDLDDLFIRGNNELNVSLYPGDVINVFTEMDAYVYVMGEVKLPGSYNLRPDMTVLDAVALAGGYTRDAQAHGVRVVRHAGENEEIFKLDLYDVMKRRDQEQNIQLMAKDIVFMPLKGVAIFSYYVRNTVPSLTTIFLGYTAGEAIGDALP